MKSKSFPSLAHLSYLSCACATALIGTASAAGLDPALESLVHQYAAVESVHIKAKVQVLIYTEDESGPFAAVGKRINGEYQYRAQNDKYRIVSRLDSESFPSIDNVVAFDGEKFQLLRNDRSVLSFGSGDRDIGAVVLPNPFLAILSFLYPQDDATWDQVPKLGNVAFTSEIEQRISNVQWSTQLLSNRELDTASFPGAIMEGVPYTLRIATDIASRSEPLRVDYVSNETGLVIASIELSHFAAADLGGDNSVWPRVVEFRAYEENGDPLATLKYAVVQLEIGQTYEDHAYWIDLNEAESLWSDDLQMFLN
jgi:hypothetical protein